MKSGSLFLDRSLFDGYEISVPRDRNGEFEPKVIEKRQTHTDEIEQKIMAIVRKATQVSLGNVPA